MIEKVKEIYKIGFDALNIKAGDTIFLGIDMGKIPLPNYTAPLNRSGIRKREGKWCEFILNVIKTLINPLPLAGF